MMNYSLPSPKLSIANYQPLFLLALAVLLAYAPILWLLALAGVVFGGVILLRHPWFIWVILGAALPWTSASAPWTRLGLVSITDLIVGLAIALWFADNVRRRTIQFHISAPAVAALAYVGVLYVASFVAVDIGMSGIQMIKWLQFALILLILPTMIDSEHHVPWLVSGLFLGAALQSLLGLYQFYFGIGPESFVIQGRFMRASGTFGQPNPYGGYLGLTLPVTLSVLSWFTIRPIRKKRIHWRDILGWTVVRSLGLLVAAALVASWSRGAWLGAIGAALVVFWLSSNTLMRTISVILVTTLLFLGTVTPLIQMVPPEITARLAEVPTQMGLGISVDTEVTDENFAIIERLSFWVAALRMWNSAPWMGIGPGNYEAVYSEFSVPRWPEPLGHAHNAYLHTLAETGLIGFGVFSTIWGTIIVLAYRSYRVSRRANRWQAALSVGILGVITHLAVHSLFDNLFVQGMFLHLSLWIAILLSLQSSSHVQQRLAKVKNPIVQPERARLV